MKRVNSTGTLRKLERNGEVIYISYRTPIAVTRGTYAYCTTMKWSHTTTRHASLVRCELKGMDLCHVGQDVIDDMAVALVGTCFFD